ncbi:MAG: hypothetical protein PWP60_191 [Candidatus Atribacteria bacterium]|uniref:PilZ domain-containing protein n=1 Tax=Thermatribacter velox TaxID=3039681 RepID=A0ABZ2YA82_9BACT|nr:hypothetical protein [Candidatus Atribacteria bacterium]
MEVERIFQVNRKASIGVLWKGSHGEDTWRFYPSRIESIRNNEVWFAAPQERGTLVPIGKGDPVQVYIVGDNEIFFFEGKAKERQRKGNLAYLILELPQKVVRKQRRNYVRLDISLPVCVRDEESLVEGLTKNISGGGMLVSFGDHKNPFPADAQDLFFMIGLHNGQDIFGKARVVRKEDPSTYAFEFTDIQEADREKIVKFIFQKQIEMKKKGLV